MSPQSFNRYSYCLNNPLKYVDPSGYEVNAQGVNVRNIDTMLLYYGNNYSLKIHPELFNITYDGVELHMAQNIEYQVDNHILKTHETSIVDMAGYGFVDYLFNKLLPLGPLANTFDRTVRGENFLAVAVDESLEYLSGLGPLKFGTWGVSYHDDFKQRVAESGMYEWR